jgi:GxxExxY protein
VYEAVLARTLVEKGFKVERQKRISFEYRGMAFQAGFRADLLVDNRVMVEVKSLERTARVHSKQLLTYIRLANIRVGLLINFGEATLRDGLHRIVNHLCPSASPHLRVNQRDAAPSQAPPSEAPPSASPRLRVNQRAAPPSEAPPSEAPPSEAPSSASPPPHTAIFAGPPSDPTR